MKKILLISVVLLCFTFGAKSQGPLIVEGSDEGVNWPLALNDYWTITYVVQLFDDAHLNILQVWYRDDLNPDEFTEIYDGTNNPFSVSFTFTMTPAAPNVGNPNYRVLVGVKRWSMVADTYVCGFNRYSGWMNYNELYSSFTVSGILVDP